MYKENILNIGEETEKNYRETYWINVENIINNLFNQIFVIMKINANMVLDKGKLRKIDKGEQEYDTTRGLLNCIINETSTIQTNKEIKVQKMVINLIEEKTLEFVDYYPEDIENIDEDDLYEIVFNAICYVEDKYLEDNSINPYMELIYILEVYLEDYLGW